MDQDAVDLVLLGMQQNGAALPASVIHGLVTSFEYGRRFQSDTRDGAVTGLRLIFRVVTKRSLYRRERYRTLSHRRLTTGRAGDVPHMGLHAQNS